MNGPIMEIFTANIDIGLGIALFLFLGAEIAALWRVVFAPGMADKLIAGSLAANLLTFVMAVGGALQNSDLLLDTALVTALLSFSSVILLTKYLVQKNIF